MPWIVRNGDVLATADIADTRGTAARAPRARRLSKARSCCGRAVTCTPSRMRFTIDVAFCDAEGRVLRTCTLAPWRVSPLLRGTAFVVEAEAGAFERWRLREGDVLELRR